MFKKSYFIFVLFFALTNIGFASEIPERPNPVRWVNNLSVEIPDFLSESETNSLENKLSNFAKETSNQIIIVIVDDLGGLEPYAYATKIGQQWGVGQSKFDNGIVILIKPTGGEGQRNLFIAVGYGLEGVIPDLTTKQIRENEMVPYFKKGEYYTALDKATNVLMALAKGEYDFNNYKKKESLGSNVDLLRFAPVIIIFFFVFLFFIRFFRRTKGGASIITSSSSSDTSFSYSDSSSSDSSSDFGGGDFGGGGSGGDW